LIDKILKETYPSKKRENNSMEIEELNSRIDFLKKLFYRIMVVHLLTKIELIQ
jgi:hypothetical protein